MASGGARNRSGPPPNPNSVRSERRGLRFDELPAQGHQGEPPEFPLPVRPVMIKLAEAGVVENAAATERQRDRELAVWAEAWRTPQASAWEREPWRWPIIAEYCRLKTVVESDPSSTAALVAQLHRYRDQLGLTPAGLRDNGWTIKADEVAAKRDEKGGDAELPAAPQRRLRLASS